MSVKEVTYSRDALKSLRRIPSNVALAIRGKIELYARDPCSLSSNVIRLQGSSGCFRLRVGDWRVIFSEDAVVVAVIRIAPRGSAYE